MTDTIPTWAIDEALRRCGYDTEDVRRRLVRSGACGWETIHQLSLMIAKHEAPPEPDLSDAAHEIWAAAQLAPGEGIVDAVCRIESLLHQVRAEPIEVTLRMVRAAQTSANANKWLTDDEMRAAITAALAARGK